MAMKKPKYNNKKVWFDGIKFDSDDECYYYKYLVKKKAAGLIQNFELQPNYELQEKFRNNQGKVIQPITYSPDFLVYHLDGSIEAVDVKTMGTATQQGELRKKMFWLRYPEIKLTWITRNLKRARIDGEWILYEDLKAELAKEAREKKKKKEKEELEQDA